MRLLELGNRCVEDRPLRSGREGVRKAEPVWTRLRQRQAIPGKQKGDKKECHPEPFSEFHRGSHSVLQDRVLMPQGFVSGDRLPGHRVEKTKSGRIESGADFLIWRHSLRGTEPRDERMHAAVEMEKRL